MNPKDAGGAKRKRPSVADALPEGDRVVLNLIKDRKDMGIWARDLKREAKQPENAVNKSIKFLLGQKLIKEVANIQYKGKKHYMAIEFEPSKEISGGVWYADGMIDQELISKLKDVAMKIIISQKVATIDGICGFINKRKVMNFDCSKEQIGEIVKSMVIDNQILEVKSTGLSEYNSIPVGTLCYRAPTGSAAAKGPKIGAMGTIPCGMCSRISLCTPDGIISPSTCVYYKKWLEF